MAFMTLDGWTVPIRHEASAHEPDEIGEGSRAYDGDWRDSVRARRTIYGPFQTTWMNLADSELLWFLLTGQGWHLPFQTDLYAAVKCAGPATGYAGTTISSAQSKAAFGSYSMKVTGGSTGPAYDFSLDERIDGRTGDWSVDFWQYIAAWKHYCFVYDADTTTYTHYVDGAVDASPDANEIAYRNAMVASGVVTFIGKKASDNSASDAYYVDGVVMPCKFTQAMVTARYASGTGLEFSDLPYVDLRGDVRKSATGIACRAFNVKQTHSQMVMDGAWSDQVRSTTFSLRSVDA